MFEMGLRSASQAERPKQWRALSTEQAESQTALNLPRTHNEKARNKLRRVKAKSNRPPLWAAFLLITSRAPQLLLTGVYTHNCVDECNDDIQQLVHSFRAGEATAEFLRAMRLGRS
jgi:hypothetical protein